MTFKEDWELATNRLILKIISLDYCDDIFREFTPEVARYLIPQPTGNIKDTINFINNHRAKTLAGQELQLVALDKKSREFMACLGLYDLDKEAPRPGVWFKKSVWGRGYGQESMLALIQWAQENLVCREISYPVFKENISSRKIVEFLGGRPVREFVEKNQKGEDHEIIEYRISLSR